MGRHARRAPPLGIVLDSSQPEPLHRQIWQQLRRAILERRLALGTRLPSSRLMAVELACARGTVLAALDQLIAEGYLETRTGSGISVAADLPDEMLVPPLAGGPQDRPGPAALVLPRRTLALLAREPASVPALVQTRTPARGAPPDTVRAARHRSGAPISLPETMLRHPKGGDPLPATAAPP